METIKLGSKGSDVVAWQKIVKVTADGVFGNITDAATRNWQALHGLLADGIVGKKTWGVALGLHDVVPIQQPNVFNFSFQKNEQTNKRVVRCIKEVLVNGCIGNTHQHELYKQFISCDEKIDLSNVHTSCGIFVRAVLYHCGLKVHAAKIGQPLIGGWVQFNQSHISWVKYHTPKDTVPNPGSIFFIQSSIKPTNCHVGFFIENITDNMWRTAEGGGGDGTDCNFGQRIIGRNFDAYGRNLIGWFDTTKINLPIDIQ